MRQYSLLRSNSKQKVKDGHGGGDIHVDAPLAANGGREQGSLPSMPLHGPSASFFGFTAEQQCPLNYGSPVKVAGTMGAGSTIISMPVLMQWRGGDNSKPCKDGGC